MQNQQHHATIRAMEQTTVSKEKKGEFTVTYANGMLERLNTLTKEYEFKQRVDTLEFALFILDRLKDEGSVTLRKR